MNEIFQRTEMLIGTEAVATLSKSRVAVFGAGGVGSYVIEALARSGIGAIDIIDNDTVSESNLNRQIIALQSTIGLLKTETAKKRVLDINPDCTVTTFVTFVLPGNIDVFDFSVYDYIVDAIDTVSGKIAIIEKASKEGIPIISSMGTGNKLDPTKFQIADISKTSVCPLARVMRYEMKKRKIKKFKVLFSTEEPIKPNAEKDERGKVPPGSISFVPSVAGLIIGGEVIKDIIKK